MLAAAQAQGPPSGVIVCPNCGTACGGGGDGAARIADLEAQVRLLTDKASAAADKLADYEDSLRPRQTSSASSAVGGSGGPAAAAAERPATPRESQLRTALAREQSLRSEAESQVTQLSAEMEELSAQLFQQANEMVAAERKARAKLEERVEVLEAREREKRKRLERLERAVGRIDRVRDLLEGGGDGEAGG